MPKKIKKWSYSRFSMYNKCPAQYEYYYIQKQPRLPSDALKRGIDIHKMAEQFVLGVIEKLPGELVLFRKEFNTLRKEFNAEKGFPEPDISMTTKLEPSTMKETDWFIGFADYIHFNNDTVTLIDYKTGKPYKEHQEQGHVYGMAVLCLNPEIEEVDVEFWYLDTGDTKHFTFRRSDLNRMLKVWRTRIDRMYADKDFEETPHRFCGWCARNVKHGGDCEC